MAKKKNKRERKYTIKELFAVGGQVTGMEPDTQKFIQEELLKRNQAAIDAQDDPWIQGLDYAEDLAGIAATVVSGQQNTGKSAIGKKQKAANGLLEKSTKRANTIINQNADEMLSETLFAIGGEKESQADTLGAVAGAETVDEVEGGEVVEQPGQEAVEVKGPSHEEGGVPANLIPGAEVFSKRVKGPDGKTMAERKTLRDKKIESLKKHFQKNVFDKVVEDSVKRTIAKLEKEEQDDVQYMQNMREFMEAQQQEAQLIDQMSPEQVEKFAGGGLKKFFDWSKDEGLPFLSENFGNIVQTFGKVAGVQGMRDVISQMRSSDTVHENHYANVGEGIEESFSKQQQTLKQVNDERKSEIDDKVRTAKALNNARARGLNALRALNVVTDLGGYEAKGKAHDMFLKNLNMLTAQKIDKQMRADVMKAQGAEKADLGNRSDNDAYFNALATLEKGKSDTIQSLGKDINKYRQNKARLALLREYSKYGYRIDDFGNVVDKDGKIIRKNGEIS